MSVQTESGVKTFTAGENLEAYRRVKISSGSSVVYADAKEPAIGITQAKADNGDMIAVRLLNDKGTFKMTASAAITALAVVYGKDDGKVDDAAGAGLTGSGIGVALEAATADGDIIEVMPIPSSHGVRFIAGQHTTVAAADTVVTGLAQVFGVVASLDADPGDDPQWVSATIGDQAGAPAAGSVVIKSWKNTGGTDPTPLAATTFSKKVNWIAFGI